MLEKKYNVSHKPIYSGLSKKVTRNSLVITKVFLIDPFQLSVVSIICILNIEKKIRIYYNRRVEIFPFPQLGLDYAHDFVNNNSFSVVHLSTNQILERLLAQQNQQNNIFPTSILHVELELRLKTYLSFESFETIDHVRKLISNHINIADLNFKINNPTLIEETLNKLACFFWSTKSIDHNRLIGGFLFSSILQWLFFSLVVSAQMPISSNPNMPIILSILYKNYETFSGRTIQNGSLFISKNSQFLLLLGVLFLAIFIWSKVHTNQHLKQKPQNY